MAPPSLLIRVLCFAGPPPPPPPDPLPSPAPPPEEPAAFELPSFALLACSGGGGGVGEGVEAAGGTGGASFWDDASLFPTSGASCISSISPPSDLDEALAEGAAAGGGAVLLPPAEALPPPPAVRPAAVLSTAVTASPVPAVPVAVPAVPVVAGSDLPQLRKAPLRVRLTWPERRGGGACCCWPGPRRQRWRWSSEETKSVGEVWERGRSARDISNSGFEDGPLLHPQSTTFLTQS